MVDCVHQWATLEIWVDQDGLDATRKFEQKCFLCGNKRTKIEVFHAVGMRKVE